MPSPPPRRVPPHPASPTSRCGSGKGEASLAPPPPASALAPRYLLRRGASPSPRRRGGRRGEEGRAARSGAAARAALTPLLRLPAGSRRAAPRRPVTRSGTREGTGKDAKSFKNMSHAQISSSLRPARRPPSLASGTRSDARLGPGRRPIGWDAPSVTRRAT